VSVTPAPTVWVIVTFSDLNSGREQSVRRTYLGSDHRDAASQTFASLEGSRVRIRELLTFDGEPRRWKPEFGVEELT